MTDEVQIAVLHPTGQFSASTGVESFLETQSALTTNFQLLPL